MIKRLPAVWETRVRSLGWEDPLEKEMATHSSTLAWKTPWGRKESDTTERLHFTSPDSPGKNTGVGYHFLLQGIFPTQGSNPSLLHCRQMLYHLSQITIIWDQIQWRGEDQYLLNIFASDTRIDLCICFSLILLPIIYYFSGKETEVRGG